MQGDILQLPQILLLFLDSALGDQNESTRSHHLSAISNYLAPARAHSTPTDWLLASVFYDSQDESLANYFWKIPFAARWFWNFYESAAYVRCRRVMCSSRPLISLGRIRRRARVHLNAKAKLFVGQEAIFSKRACDVFAPRAISTPDPNFVSFQ